MSAHAKLGPSAAGGKAKTTEKWAYVEGYDDHYMVSNHGRVMSMGTSRTDGKLRPAFIMRTNTRARDGYTTVNLYRDGKVRTEKLHQLVAKAFVKGASTDLIPHHKNGIRSDNTDVNLEWVTHSKNSRHVHKSNGSTGVIGVFHGHCKERPFRALVTVNYKKKFLGNFADVASAKAARDEFLRSIGE